MVIIGFVYPEFAVLNRDRFELGILEKDKSSISQLSDQGKIVDEQRHITYVWLLEYEDYAKFQQDGEHFFYTLDAGRSTASRSSPADGSTTATCTSVPIWATEPGRTRSP